MADRMRVTSLIGIPPRLDPPGTSSPCSGSRSRNPCLPCAPNLESDLVWLRPLGAAAEYTACLVANLRFLQEPTRPRTIAGTVVRRRRATPSPAVRRRRHPRRLRGPERPRHPAL